MTTLCGWLFRAKKSPWNTSGFAATLAEAGARYLDVVTRLLPALAYVSFVSS